MMSRLSEATELSVCPRTLPQDAPRKFGDWVDIVDPGRKLVDLESFAMGTIGGLLRVTPKSSIFRREFLLYHKNGSIM